MARTKPIFETEEAAAKRRSEEIASERRQIRILAAVSIEGQMKTFLATSNRFGILGNEHCTYPEDFATMVMVMVNGEPRIGDFSFFVTGSSSFYKSHHALIKRA